MLQMSRFEQQQTPGIFLALANYCAGDSSKPPDHHPNSGIGKSCVSFFLLRDSRFLWPRPGRENPQCRGVESSQLVVSCPRKFPDVQNQPSTPPPRLKPSKQTRDGRRLPSGQEGAWRQINLRPSCRRAGTSLGFLAVGASAKVGSALAVAPCPRTMRRRPAPLHPGRLHMTTPPFVCADSWVAPCWGWGREMLWGEMGGHHCCHFPLLIVDARGRDGLAACFDWRRCWKCSAAK